MRVSSPALESGTRISHRASAQISGGTRARQASVGKPPAQDIPGRTASLSGAQRPRAERCVGTRQKASRQR
eukprot:9755166-Alexandrium_andersonii.AAC.1